MRIRPSALVMASMMLPAAACGNVAERPHPPTSATLPQAAAAQPDRRIGAIFLGGTDTHACTGSVLHSVAGDLVLTAAHCMADGVDAQFIPAFAGAAQDGDMWKVDAVYLDPRWLRTTDQRADYAILRVSHAGSGTIEQATGPGLTLGTAPAAGSVITVTGYPYGVGGGPVSCRGATAVPTDAPATFPSLNCAGMVDGTSGAPWVSGSSVTGLIGGFDLGGCDDDLSYSPPFDANTAALLARAQAGGPGDAAPNTYGVSC